MPLFVFFVYFGVRMNLVTALPSQALCKQLPPGREPRPQELDVVLRLVDGQSRSCLGVVVSATHVDPDSGKMVHFLSRTGSPVRILTTKSVAVEPPWERCDTYVVVLGQRLGSAGPGVAGAFHRLRGDSARTRFVLVWAQGVVHGDDLNVTTAAVWNARRLNAMVVARTRPDGPIQVHDFNPFDSAGGKCNDTSPLLVANWEPGSGLVLASQSSRLFRFGRDARHLKLGGCPLRVGVRNQSIYVTITRDASGSWLLKGILGHILRACEKILNFRYQPYTELARYSASKPRDAVTRAVLTEVTDGFLDVALMPGAMNGQHEDMAIAHPGWFNSWCYTWAVPYGSGGVPPLHYKLTREFSPATWALIGASLGLACVVTSVLAHCSGKWAAEEPNVTEDARWMAASTIGPLCSALLGRSHSRRPPRTNTLRVFLACWLYVGLVLSTAYTSSLKTLVSSPTRPRTIRSVEDLAASTLPIRAYFEFIDQIRYAADESVSYRKIHERAVPLNAASELEAFIVNPSVALGHTREWLLKMRREVILRHAVGGHNSYAGAIYIFSDYCLRTVLAHPFVVHRRSILVPALQHALQLLAEAGLSPGVWTEGKQLPPSLRRQFDLQFDSGPLTLSNLLPVFILKAVADVAVILVLCLEVGTGWVRQQFSPGT
ncbi:uncharacterized protein LOC117644309 [Thrips palmi]|uniref:Uncharacterized protein LOC117644309 n=1 Tax=Thrips palmi TaxID=161013 RepID=A0A6P8ZLW0_THRPL|nr:uncharacterized protein LOC117644309 [Thrips palmi]